MNEKGSNHQLLKQKNHSLLKKHIYRYSPISRVEIAQQLGLTTAAITGMVSPLLASGLLRETVTPTEQTKGAGRPRTMLEFVPDVYYVCGIDVGVYRTSYVLTDICGNVIAVRDANQRLGEYQTTLERMAREIPDFLAETGVSKEKILGVGICLPGMIDGSVDKIYDICLEIYEEE